MVMNDIACGSQTATLYKFRQIFFIGKGWRGEVLWVGLRGTLRMTGNSYKSYKVL